MVSTDSTYPKELKINEILSISWEIYLKFFKKLFPLAFIVYLPLNIFLTFFPIGNILSSDANSFFEWVKTFSIMNFAVYLSFMGNIAIAIALKEFLNDTPIKLISVFISVYRKLIQNLANNIMMLLIVFLCFNLWMYCSVIYPKLFMVLLIPIVYYLVNWSFTIYVFSYEDINLYNSMRYSYSIVSRRWAKVFVRIIIFILLSVATSLIIGLPYSYLFDTFFMRILYNNLVSMITSYFVVAFIVFYINFNDTKIL